MKGTEYGAAGEMEARPGTSGGESVCAPRLRDGGRVHSGKVWFRNDASKRHACTAFHHGKSSVQKVLSTMSAGDLFRISKHFSADKICFSK